MVAPVRRTALTSLATVLIGGCLGFAGMDRFVAWLERARVEDEPGVLTEDWRLGWTNRPGYRGDQVSIDELGLRNPAIPDDAPADEVRVLVMGGSRVHGSGVADAEVFSAVLEDLFAGDPPGAEPVAIRVLNGGVNSYSTLQSCNRAILLIPIVQPDLVLLFMSPGWPLRPNSRVGDWERVGGQLVPADVVEPWPRFLWWAAASAHELLSHSHLYLRYRAAWLKGGEEAEEVAHFVLTQQPPPEPIRPFLADVESALAALGELAADEGVDVRVVLIPEQYQISPTAWAAFLRDHGTSGAPALGTSPHEPMRALQAMVERAGFRSWVLFEEIAYFLTDIPRFYQEDKAHWTPEGHVRMAETLAWYLRDQGYLTQLARRRAGQPR